MAANAVKLLKTPSMLELFRKQAREQASHFDITKLLPLYEEMYSEVTGKPINNV
jgi:hypothetical protein